MLVLKQSQTLISLSCAF